MKNLLRQAALLMTGAMILTANAADNDLPEGCKFADFKPEKISYLNDIPGFFANITPDGKYVAYISVKGKYINYLMRFDDPTTRIQVPFKTDPVPAPDVDSPGGYIATPNGGYALFNYDKLLRYEKQGHTVSPPIKPDLYDTKIQASYESIGVLKEGGGTKTYRIAGGSAVFNDFEVQEVNGQSTISHVGPYNRAACKNINTPQAPNKLPILSKDGKYIGNYTTAHNLDRTQIFALKDDGTCDLALDLGIPTGKIAFSYDGRHIAFHVDSFASDDNKHFTTNGPQVVKNVYVVDVNPENGKLVPTGIRRLTNNTKPGTGCYYPTFTRDGQVVCIQSDRTAKGDPVYSFHMIDPNLSPPEPLFTEKEATYCPNCSREEAPHFMLGALMAEVCPTLGKLQSAEDQALWTLSLDPNACETLVRDDWEKKKSELLKNSKAAHSGEFTAASLDEVKLADLLAACPARGMPTRQEPTVYGKATLMKVSDDPMPPQSIFENRCQECHQKGGNAKPFVWNAIDKKTAEDMIGLIESHDMPYGGNKLGPTQAGILTNALKQIK
jgi:hypothetical protein